MTPRQREALAHINCAATGHGYGISLRELADAMGVASLNAVADVLACLTAQGLVTREPGRARTLRLTEAGYAAMAGEG